MNEMSYFIAGPKPPPQPRIPMTATRRKSSTSSSNSTQDKPLQFSVLLYPSTSQYGPLRYCVSLQAISCTGSTFFYLCCLWVPSRMSRQPLQAVCCSSRKEGGRGGLGTICIQGPHLKASHTLSLIPDGGQNIGSTPLRCRDLSGRVPPAEPQLRRPMDAKSLQEEDILHYCAGCLHQN